MLRGQMASHGRRSHHRKGRTSVLGSCGDPEGPWPRRRAWKQEEEVLEVKEVSPRHGAARSALPKSVVRSGCRSRRRRCWTWRKRAGRAQMRCTKSRDRLIIIQRVGSCLSRWSAVSTGEPSPEKKTDAGEGRNRINRYKTSM